MSNHTPGPWIFEHRDGDHPLNDQNGWGCNGLWAVNGGFILGAGPGWDGTYKGPAEADARLIEAAPEMHGLLEQLAAVTSGSVSIMNMMSAAYLAGTLRDMSRQAKQLLDKIEGGGNE